MNCEILVDVTIEGLIYLGKSPATGTYMCVNAAATFPVAAPKFCTGVAAATVMGKYLGHSAAFKGLVDKAATNGCNIAVDVGKKTTRVLLVKGKEMKKAIDNNVRNAVRTYNALNSAEGISWLMNYMSSM